jgi:hypothetical protein
MDAQLIKEIKECGDKDKIIELFDEGVKTYLFELEPIVNKLKFVNKDMCIDVLESHLDFLNEVLALTTKYLTRNSTHPITAEQGLLFASLNSSVKGIKTE